MEEGAISLLVRWESFYVIVGTSAAVLTSLQFVVITLVAQRGSGSSEGNRAFGTPTIVHFGAVVFIAALLAAPWPSLCGVALVLGLCGAAGLGYEAVILRLARRQTSYLPVLEDWIWHFTLPPIGYGILLIAALMLQPDPKLSLFVVAGAVLLLLFIGIHNAWDAVTFTALNQPASDAEREQES